MPGRDVAFTYGPLGWLFVPADLGHHLVLALLFWLGMHALFALALARALGEYGSVVFISGNMPFKTEIAPVLIVGRLEEFAYSEATALAVVLLTFSFGLLIVINLLERWSKRWVA